MILQNEYEHVFENLSPNELKKNNYIGKLPAPSSGTFGSSKARLVYLTSLPIRDAVECFIRRVEEPLKLDLEWDKPTRKRSGENKDYYQINAHYKIPNWHTYISIRSRVNE